jgi:hypothetical protein
MRVNAFISRELIQCLSPKRNWWLLGLRPHPSTCCEKPDTCGHPCQIGSKCDSGTDNKTPDIRRIHYSSDFNPEEAKKKLGRLVLIGRQVQFLNRVRIVSTDEPTLNTPDIRLDQGTKEQEVTISGKNLKDAEVTTLDKRITIIREESTDTAIKLKITVPPDLPPGVYQARVGSASLSLIVYKKEEGSTRVTELLDNLKADPPTITLKGEHLDLIKALSLKKKNEEIKGKTLKADETTSLVVTFDAQDLKGKSGKYQVFYGMKADETPNPISPVIDLKSTSGSSADNGNSSKSNGGNSTSGSDGKTTKPTPTPTPKVKTTTTPSSKKRQ